MGFGITREHKFMKRIFALITLIVVLMVSALFALPFVASNQSVKQQLDARIQEFTSSKITYQGEPILSFSPYLTVELNKVVMHGEKQSEQDADLMRIEKLQFGLKILPLLIGKTRFTNFKLIRPRFNLLMHKNGVANWAIMDKGNGTIQKPVMAGLGELEEDDSALSQNQSPFGQIKLGQFEIFDGIIESTIAGLGSAFRITNMHANVDWPTISSRWNISGKGIWRGEAFEFSNRAENPIALFTSGKSELAVTLNSPAMVASFDGQATMLSDIQLQGKTSIATPSLPRLFELLLDDGATNTAPFSSFLIEGNMSANAHEISFEDANIELDKNIATGNLLLHWNRDKNSKVSGTLALPNLDIAPLLDIVTNKKPKDAQKGQELVKLNPFDFDIRFSAQNYLFENNNFGALAATFKYSKKEWMFDIGEAEFYDGVIVASIASKSDAVVSEIEMKGIMRDVSLGEMASQWYGGEIVTTGNADINFNLTAPDAGEISDFRVFSGKMNVTLTDGQIEGVDLVKAIPALITNNGFVTAGEIKGVTPFNNLSLDLHIFNGVGWITNGKATGEKSEFLLSGKADLLRGGLAVYADITQKEPGRRAPQKARIFIGGTIKNPLVTRSPLAKKRPDERIQQDG